MRLLHEESGFTLVELLVAMAIMIGVLSATLGTLEVFGNNAATNQRLVVAQDQARLALDQIARELRNGTAYTTDIPQPSAVVRALPWDLIVQTVNPQPAGAGNQNTLNLMRVRYCLDTSGGNLWRQAQTWTTAASPAVIADTSCPSTSWTNRRVVASNVVNGGARRVFTYNQGNSGDVNEPAPSVEDISSVRVALWVDLDPARAPAETQLATGVFLRNKNRRPVADCSAAATGHGHVSLNGSHSSDPEGGVLTFAWADGTTPISGTGSLVDYVSPTTGPHYFTLTVTDPGGLPSQFTCQVNVL
jgi:prepilin-type N-terminal cleavage/methylation domain-containing protein